MGDARSVGPFLAEPQQIQQGEREGGASAEGASTREQVCFGLYSVFIAFVMAYTFFKMAYTFCFYLVFVLGFTFWF